MFPNRKLPKTGLNVLVESLKFLSRKKKGLTSRASGDSKSTQKMFCRFIPFVKVNVFMFVVFQTLHKKSSNLLETDFQKRTLQTKFSPRGGVPLGSLAAGGKSFFGIRKTKEHKTIPNKNVSPLTKIIQKTISEGKFLFLKKTFFLPQPQADYVHTAIF